MQRAAKNCGELQKRASSFLQACTTKFPLMEDTELRWHCKTATSTLGLSFWACDRLEVPLSNRPRSSAALETECSMRLSTWRPACDCQTWRASLATWAPCYRIEKRPKRGMAGKGAGKSATEILGAREECWRGCSGGFSCKGSLQHPAFLQPSSQHPFQPFSGLRRFSILQQAAGITKLVIMMLLVCWLGRELSLPGGLGQRLVGGPGS